MNKPHHHPHDDDNNKQRDTGVLVRMRHMPIVAGLLCGLVSLGFYGFYFSDAPQQPLATPLYLDGGEVLADGAIELPSPDDVAQAAAPVPEVPTVWEYALVVADSGLQRRVLNASQEALPTSVGIAISVYTPDAAGVTSGLVQSGRQVWLQLASQNLGAKADAGIDAGGLALMASAPIEQNRAQLERQMSMVGKDIRGAFLRSNADITLAGDMWRTLAQGLIEQGYMILDATSVPVAGALYAGKVGEPSAYLKASVVLQGNADTPNPLKSQLEALQGRMVDDHLRIIVIENPHTEDMPILRAWIDGLAAQGIKLVEASKFSHL